LENPSVIFLTGVTGFVGIHLLQELLDTTGADIYCLVRAQDDFHAKEKLIVVISSLLFHRKKSRRQELFL
jgi:thioester reductase-like protein